MQATNNFTASINGAVFSLKKGEEFKGDKRAQELLKTNGLLKPTPRKGKNNER